VSNIGMDVMDDGTGPFSPTDWDADVETVTVDAETGWIQACDSSSCAEVRPEGTGLHAGSGISFTVIAQSGGPDIGVFSVTEADIADGVTVWVVGANAFALAASGPVDVAGAINCKAYWDGGGDKFPGPGGHGPGAGPGSGGNGSEGDGQSDGAGGTTYGTPELIPLLGGSGGGNGADNPGIGGHGGGACQIVSTSSITIASTGGVDAAGHGGDGGSPMGGGGGAGSGGGLLFESPVITIDGMVAANGGGGGSGARSTDSGGFEGERGHLGTDRAHGGVNSDWWESGCNGGHGNSATDPNGTDNDCEGGMIGGDDDGGGGGGGGGRIRLNGDAVSVAADSLSPALSTGACTQGPLPVS
jgi:hypothetical protein